MSTTKDSEKSTKPQQPARSEKKAELPTQIPDFPGDGSGGGGTSPPTGK